MAKTKSNQKRLIGLFALFLIVAAIPLTVIISQQQQETRQHAAATIVPTPISKLPPSCLVPTTVLKQITNSLTWRPYYYGDVDQDGIITAADVTLILRFLAKLKPLNPLQIEQADVDGKANVPSSASNVTVVDALLIQKYLAGIRLPGSIYAFPVCSRPNVPPGKITPTPVPIKKKPTPVPLISPWSVSPVPTK